MRFLADHKRALYSYRRNVNVNQCPGRRVTPVAYRYLVLVCTRTTVQHAPRDRSATCTPIEHTYACICVGTFIYKVVHIR